MAAVLECAPELSRVDGEAKRLVGGTNVNIGILAHGGLDSLTVIVVEAGVDHPGIVVISGHVVSEAEDASLGRELGRTIKNVRQSPVVRVGLAVATVAKMVDSAPGGLDALGRVNAKRGNAFPRSFVCNAICLIVVTNAVGASGSVEATILTLHILTLRLVKRAQIKTVGHDDNIAPRAGVPVGVVVALFWALVAATIVVGVLTGEDGGAVAKILVLQILIGCEQSSISFTAVAVIIPLPALMQSTIVLNIAILPIDVVSRSELIVVGLSVVLPIGCETIAITDPGTGGVPVGGPSVDSPGASRGFTEKARVLSWGSHTTVRAVVLVIVLSRKKEISSSVASSHVHLNGGTSGNIWRARFACWVGDGGNEAFLCAIIASFIKDKVFSSAHVLKDDFAVELVRITQLISTTSMLIGPFDTQDGALVVCFPIWIAHVVDLRAIR